MLGNGSKSGAKVLRALKAAGFKIEDGDAIGLFGEGSRPGDTATMTATTDGLLICAAPGGPMSPEDQNAPTDLSLYIRRADPAQAKAETGPPDPLADPLADINIQPGQVSGLFSACVG